MDRWRKGSLNRLSNKIRGILWQSGQAIGDAGLAKKNVLTIRKEAGISNIGAKLGDTFKIKGQWHFPQITQKQQERTQDSDLGIFPHWPLVGFPFPLPPSPF